MRAWCLTMVLAFFSCDPVHDDAVAALGPEAPGVHNGPLHRPGQPCVLCHDGGFGDPRAFSVAGTVFAEPSGLVPVNGATVAITDSTGSAHDVTTNQAGNFYVYASDWSPTYPLSVVLMPPTGPAVMMQSKIGTEGSCAGCHFDPAGPSSPGHVYMNLPDGGTPP